MLNAKKASERLGISENHLRRLVNTGMIQAINISASDGRPTYRFREEDLDAWMKSRQLMRTPLPEVKAWRARTANQ